VCSGRLEEGVEDRIEREIARLTKNLPPQYQTLSTLEPLQYNGSMNGNGNGNRSGSFKSKKYPPELRGNSSTVDLEIEDDEKYLKVHAPWLVTILSSSVAQMKAHLLICATALAYTTNANPS
jgi:hypothetical protein